MEETTMFWKDSGGREQNGVGPFGQVRVLVVGDSGVGKSSLVHLILKSSSIARPAQTAGCAVGIKVGTLTLCFPVCTFCILYPRTFVLSLFQHVMEVQWGCLITSVTMLKGTSLLSFGMSLDMNATKLVAQINGVIFVYDLSQRKNKTNLNKWAVEVAETGTFSAPLGSGGPGGIPVPYLVIANKVNIVPRDGTRVRSGSIVDVARQWIEKWGLLPCSEELPLTESFPGNSGLISAAKEARYDKEAVLKFFRMLIRRRYFSHFQHRGTSNRHQLSSTAAGVFFR